ncbi:MAG: exodeoxyribonuclease VII large subunit [Dysgonamonadaceae bacterium]|jgi:exodeoxyribonuclease VII large subunit|nr:exodeoxyribonuclease VII large subunit [Dysgonamonadaceae bacterium]
MHTLTLSQLNSLVSSKIKSGFPEPQWVMAETSDVRYNNSGHCYLELIEKRAADKAIVAKARAYIWGNTFQLLKAYFEAETGQNFVSGLKVLVKANVEFHPIYGFGLNILEIDPTYTLGDMQQQRQQILAQLEKEGVLHLNKELELPLLPQRIAVITSPTAAGYEDFLNHLQNNPAGFVFYPHLFPATMQGEQTEKSVIAALNKIAENLDNFDVVVIIRGGGATSDLASFDTYLLAANVAQFPLPIITGIGHERDDTVLDFVAHYRAKTPTAVADFLVSRLDELQNDLYEAQTAILTETNRKLEAAQENLQSLSRFLPMIVRNRMEKEQLNLNLLQNNLIRSLHQNLEKSEMQLKEKEAFIKLSSPEYILSKGYSITRKNGKIIKSFQSLRKGDSIETILKDGTIRSTVD